jgi:hypothetical protein
MRSVPASRPACSLIPAVGDVVRPLSWLLTLLLLNGCCGSRAVDYIALAVTAAGVRRVEIGMTKAQVTDILGPSLGSSVHPTGELFLLYSRPRQGPRYCPCLSVRVAFAHDKVVGVWVSHNHAYDNDMVYQLTPESRYEAKDLGLLLSR